MHAMKRGIDTARSETERRAQTKRGARDRQTVDQVSERTVDEITDDGIKRAADRHGSSETITPTDSTRATMMYVTHPCTPQCKNVTNIAMFAL